VSATPEAAPLSRRLPYRALILLVLSALLAAWRTSPSAEAPVSAPADRFSAARAARTLGVVLGAGAPHPVGSAENAAVRDRIAAALRASGLVPELEEASVCGRYMTCAKVVNIVARRPGRLERPALMLAAHYDSVPAGPGAADDGAGVATLLEVARALAREPLAEHPVIFLFDEGEEKGLLGAEAFVKHSRFSRDVGVVVNVEARGDEGPPLMFETSENNAELVRAYARSVPRPVTSSLFYAVYKRMPNDTDLSVFKAAGMQGLNLAPVGGVRNYHTAHDDLAHFDRGTLQQLGDTTLALTRELSNVIPRPAGGDLVYFDFLAFRVLRWPLGATRFVFMGLAALVFAALALGARRGFFRWSRLVRRGWYWLLPPIAATFAVSSLCKWKHLPGWPAHAEPVALLAISTALAGVVAPLAFSSKTTPWEESSSALVWWTVLAGLLAFAFPEASYLFLLPLGAAVLFLPIAFLRPDLPALGEIALAVPAVLAALLWFPTLRLMYQALGLQVPVLLLACSVLSLSLAAPALALVPLRTRRVLFALGILGALTAVWVA
jgi:hypothetical protein